jgi:hypothetical protein
MIEVSPDFSAATPPQKLRQQNDDPQDFALTMNKANLRDNVCL